MIINCEESCERLSAHPEPDIEVSLGSATSPSGAEATSAVIIIPNQIEAGETHIALKR